MAVSYKGKHTTTPDSVISVLGIFLREIKPTT